MIQIGPNSQSAPARSKRKQLVPEDHGNLARRSNSSGPMNSTIANNSPTMVQLGYNNQQQSNNFPNNCLPASHSNRRYVTKQLMSNNSGSRNENANAPVNDLEGIPVINNNQMVTNGLSTVNSLPNQQKHSAGTNKLQSQTRNIPQQQLQQTSGTKYSASAHDSVTQTVRALNEYVQGLQKSATSSQMTETSAKPIATKQQTSSQLVPVNSRSEVQPTAMSAPIYNVNGNGNTSSCSLPPLLGGGLAMSNGIGHTDNILGNMGPQNPAEYADALQFQVICTPKLLIRLKPGLHERIKSFFGSFPFLLLPPSLMGVPDARSILLQSFTMYSHMLCNWRVHNVLRGGGG